MSREQRGRRGEKVTTQRSTLLFYKRSIEALKTSDIAIKGGRG